MHFFVTGATGFIGTSLVKALLTRGEQVTVLAHQNSASKNVFDLTQVSLASTDLLDTSTLAQRLVGCDIVVHLAYGNRGTPDEQYAVTVQGTKSVLNAAIKAGVKRFIHMSTISVYGEPPKSIVYTEETCRYASLDLYSAAKQEAENIVLTTPRNGMEVVVLQPGIVYGPGKGYWARGIIEALQDRRFPLVDNGNGLANLIHVNDTVDAILLAAEKIGINGECFILTNDQPVTWKEFFKAYENILGYRCLINLPNIFLRNREKNYSKITFKILSKLHSKPIARLDENQISFFTARPHFLNAKARNKLGFHPKISFNEGVAEFQKWLNQSSFL